MPRNEGRSEERQFSFHSISGAGCKKQATAPQRTGRRAHRVKSANSASRTT